MKTIDVCYEVGCEDRKYAKVRNAARAVILDGDGRIFAEYTRNPRVVMLPGGGVEEGEDFFECVARECAEECGIVVRVKRPLFNIREFAPDCQYLSVYALCEIVGECDKRFTANERTMDMSSGWHKYEEVFADIEALMKEYEQVDGELYGCHRREFIALKELKTTLLGNNDSLKGERSKLSKSERADR